MSLENWRDLSIVWLALPAFIFSLVPLAISFLLVKGMLFVNRKLRSVFPVIHGYFRKANEITDQVSRKIIAPVIIANEKSTQVRATGSALAAIVKRRKEVTR